MGSEIAITFETLYDILMREKQREDLLPLEPSFFQDVITYLQEKMKVWEKMSGDTDLFRLGERDKIENEIKNTRKILKDIYERREKKVIALALNKSRIGTELEVQNLLMEERAFFEAVAGVFDQYRHGVLLNLLQMRLPQIKQQPVVVEIAQETPKIQQKENRTIRFVQAVPKFVGSDLAIYGPFDEDDIAHVPSDVAGILVKKGRAVEIGSEK